MARKPTPTTPARKASPVSAPAAPVSSTSVRNSPIPRGSAVPSAAGSVPRTPTHEMIARRAYEIYTSGTGGSETENWLRAERELRSAGR